MLRGSLAQNRARVLIAVLAIALGVALGFAVQLINQSAVNELTQGVRTIAGDADLSVRGPRSGFDEALFPRLARDADVAVASPVVEADVARRRAARRRCACWGSICFAPRRSSRPSFPTCATASTRCAPTPSSCRRRRRAGWDWTSGRRWSWQAGLADVPLRVAGTLAGAGQQRLAVMDIAGAQASFDRLGRLTRIDLRVRPGVSVEAFRQRIAAGLPPGVAIERPAAALAASESVSRSYRVNLNVLALVALFTGGLLVFSTQALAVVRRRSQFALLRVLGVTRRRLTALVALEAALIGVAGGALGVALGYAIARAALRFAGGDLGAGFFRGVEPTIDVDPLTPAVFFLLGVAAAMLGGAAAAREAGRAPPARALKAGDEESALAGLRPPWRGLAILALGAGLVALPPVGGLPLAGYAAIACLLVGTLLLMPWLAIALLGAAAGAAARAAGAGARPAQGRAGTGHGEPRDHRRERQPGGVDGDHGDVVPAVRSTPGWGTSCRRTSTSARRCPTSRGSRRPTRRASPRCRASHGSSSAARSSCCSIRRGRGWCCSRARSPRPTRRRCWHSSTRRRSGRAERRLPRGSTRRPPISTTSRPAAPSCCRSRAARLPFFVAGVYRDYSRPQGAVQIDARHVHRADRRPRGDQRRDPRRARACRPKTLRATIERELPGGERLEIALPGEIRALSLKAFDRTFAVTYALEIAAVAIGLMGLSSAFGALVLARRREFGVLRHLGMTRRQVGSMLATEGLATAGLGVGVGLALGAAISLDPHPRGEPAVVPLGDGAGAAVGRARAVRAGRGGAGDADRGGERAAGDGRGRRPRGQGGLVRRRAFLAWPLLLAVAPARGAGGAARRWRRGARCRSRATTAAIPSIGPSGGTSPAGCATTTGADLGIQVTFFRNRPNVAEDNPSAFAPRQLVFAHAAIADPARGRLRHDQRAARAVFDLAGAATETTRAWIGDWSLALDGETYRAKIVARDFALDLAFRATQPLLIQGDRGYSRKGPLPQQASWYYSRPQLAVTGSVEVGGKARAVTGRAWLDHEWSSEVMAPDAVGWDWVGVNLDDGGALMAFRMRDRAGGTVWAGGAWRRADGTTDILGPDAVRFEPGRRWTSPRTGVAYPVEFTLRAGGADYAITPLFDDQELDSRASTGTVYWEGAVRLAARRAPGGAGLPRAHRLRCAAAAVTRGGEPARAASCGRRACRPERARLAAFRGVLRMTTLIAGLVLFLGAHSVRIFADGWRSAQIARAGVGAWKAIYSIVSLAGFAMIVWGYGQTRLAPVDLWLPPAMDPARRGAADAARVRPARGGVRAGHADQGAVGHPMVPGSSCGRLRTCCRTGASATSCCSARSSRGRSPTSSRRVAAIAPPARAIPSGPFRAMRWRWRSASSAGRCSRSRCTAG